MSKPKVSVIIAVYNSEPYIEKCVRSLFGQTLDNVEYIFVDDCSPDKSIEIMQRVLKDYPNRENQVKVIRHEVNQGVGKSRQDGIHEATGEYIIHCDPDDWVDTNLYEVLYKKARIQNAGVVLCDIINESYNNAEISPQIPQKLSAESVLKSISGNISHWLHCSLCNKLISRHYYKVVKIPKGMDTWEDYYALTKILSCNPSIEYEPNVFYHYRIDNESSQTKLLNASQMEKDRNVVNTIMSLPNIKSEIKRAFGAKVLARDVLSSCYTDKQFKNLYFEYRNFIKHNAQNGNCINKCLLYLSCIGFHSIYNQYNRLRNKFKIILNFGN